MQNVQTVEQKFQQNAHRVEQITSGNESSADFTIDHQYTKVGGRSKDGLQIASVANSFTAASDEEYASGNKIPLWLFGFLY